MRTGAAPLATVTGATNTSYVLHAINTRHLLLSSQKRLKIPQEIPSSLLSPVQPTRQFLLTPSNLAATPGTSSIALTWTDNSSNESAFNIQRSTISTGGWSTIHSTGANVTTWTDTSPSSGITYYYQIDASNGAGSSAYDGLPSNCGVATVYAYEGFNYPTASSWNGGNTGVGFSGNWSIGNSSHASIVSGLTYTSGSSSLQSASGNALKLTNIDTATETLSQSVGGSGSTLWIGFEFSTY